jgi:acetyl/propionyl-CoA carboxylase alpha subunit
MGTLLVSIEGKEFHIEVDLLARNGEAIPVRVDGEDLLVTLPGLHDPVEEIEWLLINNRSYELTFDRDLRWIKSFRGIFPLEVHDLSQGGRFSIARDGRVKAPIPGLIARVMVENGEEITIGQPMFVLEAMKMENEIRAPFAGKIGSIKVSQGQIVSLHDILAEII